MPQYFYLVFARFTSSPSGTCGMSQGGRTATKLDSFPASLIGPSAEANCFSRERAGPGPLLADSILLLGARGGTSIFAVRWMNYFRLF